MSIAYINYHRKPRTAFMSIQEFNETHGTEIELNEQFENQFKMALMAARYETDPNDYIQHTFGMTHVGGKKPSLGSMFKPTRAGSWAAKRLKRQMYTKEHKIVAGQAKRGATIAGGAIARASSQGIQSTKQVGKDSYKWIRGGGIRRNLSKLGNRIRGGKRGEVEQEETEEQVYDEQMDFLDDYEQPAEEQTPKVEEQAEQVEEQAEQVEEQAEQVEEQAEQVEEQAKQVEEQAEQVEEVEEEEVSLSDQIDSFLAENAKDSQQFARDRSHVVHFNTGSDSLSQQLMKGRDRYMKRLQQYVDGDTSVKIRMMNNKEVLVQSLKPNIASLKDLLATPHGEPRFCVCDC